MSELEAVRAELATLAADLRKATDNQFSRTLMIGRINAILTLANPDPPLNPLLDN